MDPVNASMLIVYGIAGVGMIVMGCTFEPAMNGLRRWLTKLADSADK
ncbi:hypothetical protein [Kozakia baliensis]|nr:hypothetical protein [Kozakia baliensis]GEL65821.1 hypothetical protein KBA01_31070 [Kozakia baliensis]